MTNENKFRHETVTHCNSGAAEFLALAEELGIDLGAMVDPRTELSFAMARPQVQPMYLEGEMPAGATPTNRDTQRSCSLLPRHGLVC